MKEPWPVMLLIAVSISVVVQGQDFFVIYYNLIRFEMCDYSSNIPTGWLPPKVYSAISNGVVDPMALTLASSRFSFSLSVDKMMRKTAAEDDPDVVQFCVRHPCQETPKCIRKCCPVGMAMNRTSQLCEMHPLQPTELLVIIKDRNGNELDRDLKIHVPDCPFTINAPIPAEYGDGHLHIQSSRELIVDPYFEFLYQQTYDHCVDTFLSNSSSPQIDVMTCFTPDFVDRVAMLLFPYVLIFTSLCLLVTFAVYAALPELRNIHGVTVMCQVSSMAVMCMVKAVRLLRLSRHLNDTSCLAIAIVLHFSSLSSFTWLNVMSYDIWWTISDLKPGSLKLGRRFVFYSLFAWGVPFLIVFIGQMLDSNQIPDNIIKPDIGANCWFSDIKAIFAYLYGPFIVLIIVNVIFFILTAVRLHQASVDAALLTNNTHARKKFRIILSLFVLNLLVLGVSWMLDGIFYPFKDVTAYVWISTDVFNLLSGLFILVILVCKKKIWRLLKKRFARQPSATARAVAGDAVSQSTSMLDSRF